MFPNKHDELLMPYLLHVSVQTYYWLPCRFCFRSHNIRLIQPSAHSHTSLPGLARMCAKYSLLIKHVNTSVSCIWYHLRILCGCLGRAQYSTILHSDVDGGNVQTRHTHREGQHCTAHSACLNWFIGRVGIAYERFHGSRRYSLCVCVCVNECLCSKFSIVDTENLNLLL